MKLSKSKIFINLINEESYISTYQIFGIPENKKINLKLFKRPIVITRLISKTLSSCFCTVTVLPLNRELFSECCLIKFFF